jgi:rfaE bifunctional protein kinase chain/domain
LRVLSRQQQLLRMDFENMPTHEALLAGLARFDALLASQDVVLLSDYAKGGLTHVTQMIEKARAAGKPVLVDPKGDDWERYRGATLITPNRAELREVVGHWKSEEDLLARVTALRTSLELEGLLLTRSEEGMTLFTADGELHVPAVAREVYDVSGAGDTVIATLAVMLGARLSLVDAIALANRAAGIVVGKLGTATVDYEELFAPAG